jgi:hypothetical protein
LHTVLLAKLWLGGEILPFHVGSVTRYEGGSWLIAWPVSWMLRLGVEDTLAPRLAAAAISAFGVLGGGLWLGRRAGWRSALWLGPILALTFPEVSLYGRRAWGSLAEGLALLPWLALGFERARQGPRSSALLGAALGAAVVVSYVHAITALVALAVLVRERRWSSLLWGGIAAVAVFGGWLSLAVPDLEEALVVRGGHALPALILPGLTRLPEALLGLPAAVAGSGRSGLWAGGIVALLGIAALVRAGGGALRGLGITGAVSVVALAAGHQLADAPEVHRYALPLLVLFAAALAAWPKGRVVALVLGLGFQVQSGPPAGQPPHAVHAQLGANAQARVHADPDIKIKALWRVCEPWARPWLLYGYGLDRGREHDRVVSGMDERIAESGSGPRQFAHNPHFSRLAPPTWVAWSRPLPEAERQAFLFGFGSGLAEDGLQPSESVLLSAVDPSERYGIERGRLGEGLTSIERAWRSVDLPAGR